MPQWAAWIIGGITAVFVGAAGYSAWRLWRGLFQNLFRDRPIFGDRGGTLRRGDLVTALRFFMSLEQSQVKFYERQRQNITDPHLSLALQKFSDVEQQHAHRVEQQLHRLGAEGLKVHRGAGEAWGVISGLVTRLLGEKAMLNAGHRLEQKAIDHYLRLYRQCGDPELKKMLMDNLIDEETHSAWFREKLAQVQEREEGDSY
ncbi:MAG: ferritin-like domain-containing protein [Firmicutes bacterium]|nr:ferritin-like domain-containing protein [Bacillota bacterium]